jgi:hypothetical protein
VSLVVSLVLLTLAVWSLPASAWNIPSHILSGAIAYQILWQENPGTIDKVKHYTPPVTQIPVEFQGAAYRFGHSMVRPSYRANFTSLGGQPFFGMIFDPS